MALIPGISVGSYEVVGALGAGGMGQGYRARDSRLHRDVAIKSCGRFRNGPRPPDTIQT
jgi:hypothetical protein